jgi:murein DD-endopeptidase MepM/ murein hydrolase activator NlpD
MKALWFWVALSFGGSPAFAADITGRVSPQQPIAERGGAGESLNFDIILRNQNSFAIELTELEVTYRDKDGTALVTRRVDGNGGVPSIGTLGDLKIAAQGQRLFFNPFPVVPPEVRPASVTVHASFERSEGEGAIPDLVLQAEITRSKGKSSLLLPLTGRVLVWDGHDLLSHHRRWDYTHSFLTGLGFASNAMRYSYDFVPVDAAGEMKSSKGTGNASYFGFGAPIRAPARGSVVAAVADQPDDGSFNPEDSKKNSNALVGNHVVIDHGDGTFSIFGHVKSGSVTVAVGQSVRPGDVIAAIGSSGSSLFPHLHYQLVDAPSMSGEGLPSYFQGVELMRGKQRHRITHGHVDSGDVLISR